MTKERQAGSPARPGPGLPNPVWPGALLLAVVLLFGVWCDSERTVPSRPTAESGSTGVVATQPRPGLVQLTAKDARGQEWTLVASGESRGEVSPTTASPPSLVGTVQVRETRGPGDVSLLLALETEPGQRVASVTVDGERPPEPKFAISDASGQEVASGNFRYG